jgi:hypothetical protein
MDKGHDDNNVLGIDTIYNNKIRRNRIGFSLDNLMNRKENKKRRLQIEYEKVFDSCLKKIAQANHIDMTDIIFEIPTGIIGCYDFSIKDCSDYILDKLKRMYMDVVKLSYKSIFISWYYIKENRDEYNKLKDNNKSTSS